MPLSTCLCQITFPFSDLWYWGRRPSWFTECGWNKYSENARCVCTKLWPLKNPYTAGFRSRTNKEIIQIPSHSFPEVFSYHKMKLQSPNGLLPRCPICGNAFSGEDISFELITRSQQFLSQLIMKWMAHSSTGSYQLQLTAKHTQKKPAYCRTEQAWQCGQPLEKSWSPATHSLSCTRQGLCTPGAQDIYLAKCKWMQTKHSLPACKSPPF